MRLLTALALATTLLLPAASQADGLIYQLPDDGTSAEFDLKASGERNGQTMDFDGTFTIKSVGKQKVDDVDCRWIEFKMVAKQGDYEQTIRIKALIPEQELARGKEPIAHVKKLWFQLGERNPREVTDVSDRDVGPLPAFLGGPFKEAKELDAQTVESSLGKLDCKGVTGTMEYTLGGSEKFTFTFTNRLHEKAPFGVVSSKMEIEVSRDGQVPEKGTMQITLSKVGKEAKSDLPDSN